MNNFVGEIRLFPFGVVPNGWKACDGQLLSIRENPALYTLIQTQFGGEGSTFALPDLRGRVPLASDGVTYKQGVPSGEVQHVLSVAEMPSHNHVAIGAASALSENSPSGNTWGAAPGAFDPASDVTMHAATITMAGGGESHPNMQPTLALNYCIALQGLFPPR